MNKQTKTPSVTFDDAIRYIIKEELTVLYSFIKEVFEKKVKTRDQVMDFNQFCKYVGCSQSHAYKLTSKRLVPFSRKNGKLWFQQSQIDMWLMSNPIKTRTEVENEVENYLASKC